MQGFGGSEGMTAILKGLRCGMASVRFPTSAADTFFLPLAPTSGPAERSVFQQPWPVLKYKVYHILDAKSLVSSPARGDPEDKCSFPE